MEKSFGIPYIAGLPYGEKYALVWLEELKKCISNVRSGNRKPEDTIGLTSEEYKECKVLILGEQLQANSIRNALRAENQIDSHVGGICGWNSKFAVWSLFEIK